MKRLYKYIWFWVKVFQNVCLPPHWRVDFVTRPPMALILLLHSEPGLGLSAPIMIHCLHVMAGGGWEKWVQTARGRLHFLTNLYLRRCIMELWKLLWAQPNWAKWQASDNPESTQENTSERNSNGRKLTIFVIFINIIVFIYLSIL